MKKLILVFILLFFFSSYGQTYGDTKNQVKKKIGPNHQDFGSTILQKSSDSALIYMFVNNRLTTKGWMESFNTYQDCLREQGKYIKEYRSKGYKLSKKPAEIGETLLAKLDYISIEVKKKKKEENGYWVYFLATSTAF